MNYDINTKYLEYFIIVAKIGSINKAAQALFISQPHLGKIIRELEEQFDVLLFNRSSQGVTLTPEGERVLKVATDVLEKLDGLQLHPANGEEGFEHLTVSMTKFSHIMESFIEVVLRYQDQASFTHRLYEGNPADVVEDVASGRANVGVFHFDSRRRDEVKRDLAAKGLTYRTLAHVEPHIVLSKNHPLVLQKKPVNLKTLSEYGFIRYLGQYDDLVYDLFDAEPWDSGRNNSKVVYVSTRGTLMRLISESSFYSLGIHDFDLQDAAYQAMSIPISDSNLMFEFGYTTMKGVPVSSITNEFISVVKKRLM